MELTNKDGVNIVYDEEYANYHNGYIKELLRTHCYEMRKKMSDDIRVHSEGDTELISELLNIKLPTEPAYITQYRIENINSFGGITKTYFSKVLNTLSRIQRAEDFIINYKPENLKAYFTNSFQGYQNIEDWYFKYALKFLLQEPNGYMVVLPAYLLQNEALYAYKWEPVNEYLQLSVTIVPACKILYEEPSFIIIEGFSTDEYNLYITIGDWGIYVTKETKKTVKYGYNNTEEISYTTTTIGVLEDYKKSYIKFGGVPKCLTHPNVYESLISGVVPYWNQAIVENSNKQAAVQLHVFPEKWRIRQSNCKQCGGGGVYEVYDSVGKTNRKSVCGLCSGTGEVNSPFNEHVYDEGMNVDSSSTLPFPRAGYIEKNNEMVEYLDKDVKQNILSGLAALNLEFLMDVPLNQSGVAKEYDRQELNTFVYNVAYHAINVNLLPLLNCIAYMNNIKVSITANIPTSFDFLRSDDERKLIEAINNKFSPTLINLYEKRLLAKTFDCYEDQKNIAILINTHNPFPYRDAAELVVLLDKGLIEREDFVFSTNIHSIIKDVYYNNNEEEFMKLSYLEQYELIYNYVEEEYSELQATESVTEAVQPKEEVIKEEVLEVLDNKGDVKPSKKKISNDTKSIKTSKKIQY